MSKRSATDPEWADEVIRRWQRRRALPLRQLEAALMETVTPILEAVARAIEYTRRWPRLYRFLTGD